MKLLNDLKLNKIDKLISLAVFGSYGTKYWREGNSDIDILVLMIKRYDIMDEINLEEIILPILKKFFNYENIHLTFLNMSDYDNRLAKQYLDSKNKLIIDEFKEIDFRLYVNKYLRENEWLIRKTREDSKLLEDINGSRL
ncbi:nucleotidyltransferase domain-containing protein [Clostridium sartagoforme]|uniref:nucleotidyltransferase domain-containing protein n=1 Tax=Clostridium sartagoforme TaxID=84031 RepID=UPI0031D59DBF